MGAVKAALGAALLLWPAAASGDPVDRWGAAIARASARFHLPEPWVRRIMRIESGGNAALAGKPVVSHAGAMGLMQLMPGTWRDMRARLRLGRNPFDPSDNILAGTAYLRAMYDRFGYPGLFAAYNAGPARYAAFLSGVRPLPAETRFYVVAAASVEKRHGASAPWPSFAPIFVPAVKARGEPAERSLPAVSTGLFVRLSEKPAG